MKSEMLNQLTLAVKDRSLAIGILNKIVLINIAAEFNAYNNTYGRTLPGILQRNYN